MKSDRATGYVLVSPAFLIIFLAMIAPLLFGIVFSLFHYQFGTGTGGLGTFAFLSNYRSFFTESFGLQSLKVTILFTIMALGGELVIGMLIANLLMRVPPGAGGRPARLVLRSHAHFAHRCRVDLEIHVRSLLRDGVQLPRGHWAEAAFRGPELAELGLACIALTDIWETTPFMLLVLTAGLAAIPLELYEASDIDGAGHLRKLFSLTIPMLKKVVAVVVLVRGGDAVRVFDIIYALTAGGPANSTTSLSIYAFKEGFIKYQMGYAMAISLLTLALLAGVFGPLTRVTTDPERLR